MNLIKAWIGIIGILTLGMWLGCGRTKTFAADRKPVVVELFTSEGCSDCPPADQVLARLAAEQPVPGANVIVLGEHVDYWNQLGWADPFSSAQFSGRQSDYAHAFGRSDVFTPEMIVDGRDSFVGSNYSRAVQAIAQSASKPGLSVTLSRMGGDPAAPHVRIRVDGAALSGDSADIWLAIAQNRLSSKVLGGENRGRTLAHTAVVRRLSAVGRIDVKSGSFESESIVSGRHDWKREDLSIVVFAQSRKTRAILGAAILPFVG
jgi:hypothetical protein